MSSRTKARTVATACPSSRSVRQDCGDAGPRRLLDPLDPLVGPVLSPVVGPLEPLLNPLLDPLEPLVGPVLSPVVGQLEPLGRPGARRPVVGSVSSRSSAGARAGRRPVLDLVGPAPAVVGPCVPVVGVVDDVIQGFLPTGWLYDGTATSMAEVRAAIGANALLARGYTGRGVGVALVDTGVVPVKGLDSGNVVNGAGPVLREPGTLPRATSTPSVTARTWPASSPGEDPDGVLDLDKFQGVAPEAQLTSLKVAASDGAVDVSQVVAAVDWVVEHRNDDPANPIRVLNLSFGTDGIQDYRVDPLTHAVENAWRAGIVVVVSGGNDGHGARDAEQPRLRPLRARRRRRRHPRDQAARTTTSSPSSPAEATRAGVSTWSHPGARSSRCATPAPTSTRRIPARGPAPGYFKGSGTSQAAAVVSGAVALLLDQRPGLTPDQVKACSGRTAAPMPLADAAGRGAGEINLGAPQRRDRPRPRPGRLAALDRHRLARAGPRLLARRRRRRRAHAARTTSSGRGTPRSGRGRAATAPPGRAAAGTGRDWTGGCWCAETWAGAAWRDVLGRPVVGRALLGGSQLGGALVGGPLAGRAARGPGARWAGTLVAGGPGREPVHRGLGRRGEHGRDAGRAVGIWAFIAADVAWARRACTGGPCAARSTRGATGRLAWPLLVGIGFFAAELAGGAPSPRAGGVRLLHDGAPAGRSACSSSGPTCWWWPGAGRLAAGLRDQRKALAEGDLQLRDVRPRDDVRGDRLALSCADGAHRWRPGAGWRPSSSAVLVTSLLGSRAGGAGHHRRRPGSGRGRVGEVFAVGQIGDLANACFALVAVFILTVDWRAGWLLGVVAGVLMFAYRSYEGARQRSESLEQVNRFTEVVGREVDARRGGGARVLVRGRATRSTSTPCSCGSAAGRRRSGTGCSRTGAGARPGVASLVDALRRRRTSEGACSCRAASASPGPGRAHARRRASGTA